MQTRNVYAYPLGKAAIKKLAYRESPAHRVIEHKGAIFDLRNAVDLLCDEGSAVGAAMDGEIKKVFDGVTKNYSGEEMPPESALRWEELDGNFVVIKHPNDEWSIYSHLQPGSIAVKKGDKVGTGHVLGRSGTTGWSAVPHLHLAVFRVVKKDHLESLEIRWKEQA